MKKETEEKKTEPVVKTPEERKRLQIEGIKKTVVPAFIGAGFAFLFFWMQDKIAEKPWYSVFLLAALVSYGIQKLLYPSLGVKVEEFKTMDWLGVEFLTIIFLMIVWILLLNVGTLDVTANPDTIKVGVAEDVVATVSSSGAVIAGATVNLTGEGVNMSNFTEKDGIAYFNKVNATGAGNITISARMTGYGSKYKNISSR